MRTHPTAKRPIVLIATGDIDGSPSNKAQLQKVQVQSST